VHYLACAGPYTATTTLVSPMRHRALPSASLIKPTSDEKARSSSAERQSGRMTETIVTPPVSIHPFSMGGNFRSRAFQITFLRRIFLVHVGSHVSQDIGQDGGRGTELVRTTRDSYLMRKHTSFMRLCTFKFHAFSCALMTSVHFITSIHF
jgi:hypothetical protein